METNICPTTQCTGCGACSHVCPASCIDMVSDSEGFYYPRVDHDECSGCGLCRSTCPSLVPEVCVAGDKSEVYACWHRDDSIRLESASGGVFSALAHVVLGSGGVVVGAAFDSCMRVRHVIVGADDELGRLRNSKYVQSDITEIYTQVKSLLHRGRKVLFTGTPCQVAGLRAGIGMNDKNLIMCDLLCHGVSSPEVFREYVAHLETRFGARLIGLNFRHKREGWALPSTVASFDDGRRPVLRDIDDSFMYSFSNNITLRPVCYRCMYRSTRRVGDISLGDFWGIGQTVPFGHDTRKGVSLVLVNSQSGFGLFEQTLGELGSQQRSMDEATRNSGALGGYWPDPATRERFFADFTRMDYGRLAGLYLVDRGAKRLLKRALPRSWIARIRGLVSRTRR